MQTAKIFEVSTTGIARREDGVGLTLTIQELFAIDERAHEQKLDQAARHQLRQQYAPALLEHMQPQIEAARKSALPASALAKACDYTLGLWPKLICFLEHPQLERKSQTNPIFPACDSCSTNLENFCGLQRFLESMTRS